MKEGRREGLGGMGEAGMREIRGRRGSGRGERDRGMRERGRRKGKARDTQPPPSGAARREEVHTREEGQRRNDPGENAPRK